MGEDLLAQGETDAVVEAVNSALQIREGLFTHFRVRLATLHPSEIGVQKSDDGSDNGLLVLLGRCFRTEDKYLVQFLERSGNQQLVALAQEVEFHSAVAAPDPLGFSELSSESSFEEPTPKRHAAATSSTGVSSSSAGGTSRHAAATSSTGVSSSSAGGTSY